MNKWFNAFILIGTTLSLAVVTAIKLQHSSEGDALLIIAAVGSFMGILSTLCSANAKILTFIFGFFDVSIYAVMCFIGQKYGNAALHALYFVPMQFVGYFQWRSRGSGSGGELKARRLSAKQWLLYGGIFIAGLILTYFILAHFDKSAADSFIKVAVLTDALATLCNIFGQLLMSTAYMEQWIFWIGVNVSSVAMWTTTLITTPDSEYALIYVIKYAFYLLNSLNGLRIWIRLSRSDSLQS